MRLGVKYLFVFWGSGFKINWSQTRYFMFWESTAQTTKPFKIPTAKIVIYFTTEYFSSVWMKAILRGHVSLNWSLFGSFSRHANVMCYVLKTFWIVVSEHQMWPDWHVFRPVCLRLWSWSDPISPPVPLVSQN